MTVGLLLVVLVAVCSDPPAAPAAKVPPVGNAGGIATTYTGSGPKVVILGDSLTVLEWNDLYEGLDSRYSVRIGAWKGEGYNPGPFSVAAFHGQAIIPYVAKRWARSHPAIVVIALGTNDALSRHSTSIAISTMDRMVREFRGACMVGITIPENSTVASWSNSEAHALNLAMRSWADQIVHWTPISDRPGILSDGIHTTPKGTQVRTDAIISAIERCTS